MHHSCHLALRLRCPLRLACPASPRLLRGPPHLTFSEASGVASCCRWNKSPQTQWFKIIARFSCNSGGQKREISLARPSRPAGRAGSFQGPRETPIPCFPSVQRSLATGPSLTFKAHDPSPCRCPHVSSSLPPPLPYEDPGNFTGSPRRTQVSLPIRGSLMSSHLQSPFGHTR